MDNNLIEKIIEIPANKFIDTSINTVIIVFNKNKKNTNIEFVYENGTSKNISYEEIVKNDYNLATNIYEEIIMETKKYEKPAIILEKVISMEEEIQKVLQELRGNL